MANRTPAETAALDGVYAGLRHTMEHAGLVWDEPLAAALALYSVQLVNVLHDSLAITEDPAAIITTLTAFLSYTIEQGLT